MKKYGILVAVLVTASISLQVRAQDPAFVLQTLTYEECNTSSFFEHIRNGTQVAQYVSANGTVLNLGDTLVLSMPGGSEAVTDVVATGGHHVAISTGRTNVRAQYSTIIMGKPAGFGNIINAMNGMQADYVSADMQGEFVVISEMSVYHDGGRRKPLELTVLLGEPNGRAFGIYKYMSITDYEASVIRGEIKPLHAPLTRDEALAKLREAKDLFDLGLLSEEEYNNMRDELSPIILGN
jgi:hypothetical protein